MTAAPVPVAVLFLEPAAVHAVIWRWLERTRHRRVTRCNVCEKDARDLVGELQAAGASS